MNNKCFWPPYEVLLEQHRAEKPLPAAAVETWRKQLQGGFFFSTFHTLVPWKEECWKGAAVGSLTYRAQTKPAILARAEVPLMDSSFSVKLQPLFSKGRLAFEPKERATVCQLWAGPWPFVCALAAVFVVGVRDFSWWRTEQIQFTLDCFHRIHAFPRACLSVSGVQWVKPWSLIHNQFVLLNVPSGKASKVCQPLRKTWSWRSKTNCLRTSTSSCPLV